MRHFKPWRRLAGRLTSPLVQFNLVVLLALLAASIGLSMGINQVMTRHLLAQHQRIYPTLLELALEGGWRTASGSPWKLAKTDPAVLSELKERLANLTGASNVRLWDENGRLVGEKSALKGQTRASEKLVQALSGRASRALVPSPEGDRIELYLPLIHAGQVEGAICLSEPADRLRAMIQEAKRAVRTLVLGTGVALYLLLFAIFFQATRRQSAASRQLALSRDMTIYALAYQAELRDLATGRHIERTRRFVRILAEELSRRPEFRGYLTAEYVDDLSKAAQLHDIGKVGVPDSILLKPGPLSEEEFDEVKKHSEYGAMILEKADARLSFQSFLKIAIHITRHHHERWDGRGYPAGLAGERIPLSARIMALADVYDALRSQRPYKRALDHTKCVEIIEQERSRQFDPRVVDAFLNREKEFKAISEEMVD